MRSSQLLSWTTRTSLRQIKAIIIPYFTVVIPMRRESPSDAVA
jgi:hypothetical protein